MRTHRLAGVVLIVSLVLSGVLVQMPGTASASQAEACFAETGQCLRGRFLDYWQANGGLASNGFPLSGERREILEDGNEYTVQYFERVRLEYHPENPPPYDVLLGQFGRRVLLERSDRRALTAPADPIAGRAYFAESGHNLGGRFLDYWQQNGGLAQFGYPITEEFAEVPETGPADRRAITVQYFERARLEHHPEHAGTPYEVLLGQFGRRILTEVGLLAGDFGRLYTTNEAVRERVGPPRGPVEQTLGATHQFERGRMFYRGDTRRIYVFCGTEQAGQILGGNEPYSESFADTWDEGQEPGGGQAPVPGLFFPERGFGKVWRENQRVRDCLGYAVTADETGYPLMVQRFRRGLMFSTPDGRFIYVVAINTFSNGGFSFADYERFAAP